jgi:hypothetical protein
MDTTRDPDAELAAERLAGEVADVEASIALVASGVATSITLTSLRFGQQLAASLKAHAARQGADVEASFWPEDDRCDLHISRTPGYDAVGRDEARQVAANG